ncbi:MAG: hypothetical protein A2504_09555 [Bdellovibrionales bacterium RIFOXYD12_FULL_39_22]|nr:MAG: hypothetical protein A2385_13045 [Bdellovibrionales bacterium RIFOXYB1_FULL_39_21]OFZ40972.1 MAG: hypothetical protein A2485_16555 [Bdellovibrionales bacterium RIFOXYC12_FULL_39_17]OFZ44800.1 MAG: hypothetical protein A2404_09845 [Bdellovibrionales bacterium RIFOXYC1_FULL_39_130]OFZ74265.1 MAG: hypothetical protein A2560_16810 [Bdellovibrionales bacterium RIFOXYD1_FULL_39_84]OFZ92129.1 MAG: hypothetical protein A2504_09555 [Bdellovibrionales bacterium RIFOXYD12_FULL_39_22]HLE12767.1 hy
MKNANVKISSIILLSVYFLLLPQNAYAYLDPASISMFAQVVIAGVVGALVFVKGGVSSIKNFFNKIFKKSTPPK